MNEPNEPTQGNPEEPSEGSQTPNTGGSVNQPANQNEPTGPDQPTTQGAAADEVDGGAPGVRVEPIEIQTEMEQSFLEYAMSVIVSRALPDVRDGLKPVHRRILWSMYDNGVRPDRSHVKCATVVGATMGTYHPHGDSAIYDALVRMGQTFSLSEPLIDSHGNFGSPADQPAAMRYTECRMSKIAMKLVADIDEDTVDFTPNFDGNHDEPTVLPARFPNLLVNGNQGIAVGMATNIPPHNLDEVVAATLHLIDNPDASVEDLMTYVKGPDFPTGGKILGTRGIEDAYRTGRGSIRLRAEAEIVETARGGHQIVVTEIPYQTSAEAIEKKTADLVNADRLDGIRNIRNESAKGKTRLVFELRRDAVPNVVLNNLYKYTQMQTTFSVNMVALDDGVPRLMNLRDVLVAYVEHQIEVVTRRTKFRLGKAKAREHIVEGLLKAIDMIDAIINTIRSSDDRNEARIRLMAAPFEFSEIQANHILDMSLASLTRLGRVKLEEELAKLRETIAYLESILESDAKLRGVISDELRAVLDNFGHVRRTELTFDPGEFDIEDLIDDEELIFTLTDGGYVKTTPAHDFRTQGRGGRGVRGAALKEGDLIEVMIHTTAHAYLLFFTNHGKAYQLRVHEVPVQSRTARGTALVNLLQLDPDEEVMAVIDTRDYETMRYLMFVTRNGIVKKTAFSAYGNIRQNGLRAIKMREGDELVRVVPTNGDLDICLVTKNGRLMRFHPDEVRAMGRVASGVIGVKLKDDDRVVSCSVARPQHRLLVVATDGSGKRTNFEEFSPKRRGGMGVRCMRLRENAEVVRAISVLDDDDVMLVESSGVMIRTAVNEVSIQGTAARGVRVMSVPKGERVVAMALVREPEDDTDSTDNADSTDDAGGTDNADVDTGAGTTGDNSVDHSEEE